MFSWGNPKPFGQWKSKALLSILESTWSEAAGLACWRPTRVGALVDSTRRHSTSVCSAFTCSTVDAGPVRGARSVTFGGEIHRARWIRRLKWAESTSAKWCVREWVLAGRFRKLTATSIKCHALAYRRRAVRDGAGIRAGPGPWASAPSGRSRNGGGRNEIRKICCRRKRRERLSWHRRVLIASRRRRHSVPCPLHGGPCCGRWHSEKVVVVVAVEVVIYLVMTRRSASVTKHPCRPYDVWWPTNHPARAPDVRPSPVDILYVPKLY